MKEKKLKPQASSLKPQSLKKTIELLKNQQFFNFFLEKEIRCFEDEIQVYVKEVTKKKSSLKVLKNVSPTGRSGGVTTRQAELRWEQKQAPQSEVRLAAPFAPHPSLPVTRRLRTLSRQTFLESDASSLDALVAAVSAPHRRCRTR